MSWLITKTSTQEDEKQEISKFQTWEEKHKRGASYPASEGDWTNSGACNFEKASHAHEMWPSAITLRQEENNWKKKVEIYSACQLKLKGTFCIKYNCY